MEMEGQRADPLRVRVVCTRITVTRGRMVKWEYKLTDTLGDAARIGASGIVVGQLQLRGRARVCARVHMAVVRATRVVAPRHTFPL